jgi:hypothetical protein
MTGIKLVGTDVNILGPDYWGYMCVIETHDEQH